MSERDQPKDERFLDALVEELRAMTDTDVLDGKDPEQLVKLGERLLEKARNDAGQFRLENARKRLSVISSSPSSVAPTEPAEARRYLRFCSNITLAARNLNDLSDSDVLDLYMQAKSLEEPSDFDPEGTTT